METNPLWKWVGALCRAGNRLPTQACCCMPKERLKNSGAFGDENNEMNFPFSFVLLSKEMNNYAWCSNKNTGLSSFTLTSNGRRRLKATQITRIAETFLLDVILYGLLPCRRREEEVSNERPVPTPGVVRDYPSLVFRFIFNWISLFIRHQISFTFSFQESRFR